MLFSSTETIKIKRTGNRPGARVAPVQTAPEAAAPAYGIPILRRIRTEGQGIAMGNSTGSMFYAFGAFLILYIIGASIYQLYLLVKKWKEHKHKKK